ncbi:MAG: motility associated factor glycosyltransferase family protein [Oceanospirillaceae bacterium]|nr:motility associated factor glycosyltransferase family protein [Oceanospirillaceae bacterium]
MQKHKVTQDTNSLLDTYAKNMAFFKDHMPAMYDCINNRDMQRLRIEFNEHEKLDIFDGGFRLYKGDAEQYAIDEANAFLAQFAPGARIHTIVPPHINMYEGGRFGFVHMNNTVTKLMTEIPRQEDSYVMRDYYALCVVFGVGAGLHIQHLIDNKDIHHLIIVENDIEHFIASCYITAWHVLIPKFRINEGRTVNIIITGKDNTHEVFVLLWNQIITLAPKFPLTAIYYNHRKNRFYDEVIKKIQQEFTVFISAWGNYDDEINQLNHGLHNLKNKAGFLPIKGVFSEAELEKPVVIVGGGPSLDARHEWIEAIRDDIILISAGSSIRSLMHYGLKPDMHMELESDFNTVTMFEFIGKDYTYDIPVIAPIQISPLAMDFFKTKKLFFKDSSAQIDLFNTQRTHPIIPHATPTCTNTALATMLYYGFKNVFLIGMDFSYKQIKKSHAAGSIYFDENAPEVVKHAMELKDKDARMHVKDMYGNDSLTDPIYFTALKRIENCLREYNWANVYNLSMGMDIAGTKIIHNRDEAMQVLNNIDHNKTSNQQIITRLFYTDKTIIGDDEIKLSLNNLYEYISITANTIKEVLNKVDGTRDSLERAIAIIIYINEQKLNSGNYLYYFIRGAIWHYMYIGYAHINTLNSEDDIRRAIDMWRNDVIEYFEEMKQHYLTITSRELDHSDPWLYKSIYEKVPE